MLGWRAFSQSTGDLVHAHRRSSTVDGSDPAKAVRRDRARGSLVDRRTGSAWARRDPVCEWRLIDFGKARGRMAARVAPGRFGARCQCAAHADAGAGASAPGRLRLPAFPPGLLSIFAVRAPVDAVRLHLARPAGPARAPTGLHDVQ